MLREDADSKLIDIFEAIRYEKKWINLSMADKLDFIVGMDKSLKMMRKIKENEKINAITPEFLMRHISDRGDNRLRRLRRFFIAVEERRVEFLLTDRDANSDEIRVIKKMIRGRDATESEIKTFEELKKRHNL